MEERFHLGCSWWRVGGVDPGDRRPGRRRLQVDAEADAAGLLAAAEGAANRERAALADAPPVADRQRFLAALEPGAHRDAPARALRAGGVDRHVEHRRAHRALA